VFAVGCDSKEALEALSSKSVGILLLDEDAYGEAVNV
jgi:hypothetical protein